MWFLLDKQGRTTRWSWEQSISLRRPEIRLSISTWNYCCSKQVKVHGACLVRYYKITFGVEIS